MTLSRFAAIARWLATTSAALASVGCFYGGSPGTGGQGAQPGGVSAELDWADASGPVNGYRVFISRNEAPFEVDQDVPGSTVYVSGEPLDTVRIQVAAFDADGQLGPLSEPSDLILLTAEGTALVISTASPTMTANASAAASTRSLAPSAVSAGASSSVAAASTPPASDVADADTLRLGEKTRGDLLGDGVANLLWEAGDFLRITQLTGGTVESLAVLVRPDAAWSSLGSADFDGDGRGDPLWEHDDGALAYTSMGRALEVAPDAPLTQLAALVGDEVVVGSGDLDADGRADLLVNDGLEVSAWFSGAGPDMLIETVADLAAAGEIVGIGDLDGDDHSDLLWRGPDGGISAWLMEGAEPREIVDLALGTDLDVIACADVDGDGGDDIVLRDRESGALSIHPLVAAGWDVVPAATGLAFAGSGDYDGNGRADLLWDSGAGLELWTGVAAGSVSPRAIVSDMHADWALLRQGL